MQIDRAGTFRGNPVDWGVTETKKNHLPQFVVKLAATEFYDEEKGEYIPWGEYEQEMTAYFVLFTDKSGAWEEIFHVKSMKDVFGWDGLSFESLANGNYGDLTVLFRVEENEFEGNITLQVQWIDQADSSPTRQLQKMDTKGLAAMTTKLGSALSATAVAPKPATAPKKATRSRQAKPKAKKNPTQSAPSGSPPTVTSAPVTPVPDGPPSDPEPETKESAWAAVESISGVDADKLAKTWLGCIACFDKSETEFTSDDWATLRIAVVAETAKF